MDDFDQFCSWAKKPNEYIKHYQTRTLGSYEILDRTDEEDISKLDNEIDENGNVLGEINYDEPLVEKESSLYRIRSFRRTHKGVVNQGDTVKSSSHLSLNIPTRSKSFTKGENLHRFGYSEKSPISSPDDGHTIDILVPPHIAQRAKEIKTTFEIFVIGKRGVGKTALCEQFLTSETYGFSSKTDSSERAIRQVTVELDDIEWNLLLHDYDDPTTIDTVEKVPDAYIIVYSIEDKESFDWSIEVLQNLLDSLSKSAIFIVANKSDLERLRQVSSEKGKRLANIYDAEFFEISTVLNHMVDTLLVQIIIKIRKHKKQQRKSKDIKTKYSIKHKKSTPSNVFVDFFRRLSKVF